jgi:hypothetical protein
MNERQLKPLVKALDAGYRHRPADMLGYFLSETMKLWGLPEWQPCPADAVAQVKEAIAAYAAIVESEAPLVDVLGPLYMALRSGGARDRLGQFFTPWSIASMMAAMTCGERAPSAERPGELVRACDPCCGSGVMMMAFASHVATRFGPAELRHLSLLGCDLDPYCARMMAVQMMMNCSVHRIQVGELIVLQGNSLLPSKDMSVVLHASAPSAQTAPALHPRRLEALASAARSHPDALEQLPLFEEAA